MTQSYDYHFLILGDDLPPAWLHQAARTYCLRFSPIITADVAPIAVVPPSQAALITIVARGSDIPRIKADAMQAARGPIQFDLVVADDLPFVEVILGRRAESNRPIG